MTDFAPITNPAAFSAASAANAMAGTSAAREAARRYAKASSPSRSEDNVDVSDEAAEVAFYMGKLRSLPVRQELVDRVKAEIAKGTYDTPAKLSAAIQEMLSDELN